MRPILSKFRALALSAALVGGLGLAGVAAAQPDTHAETDPAPAAGAETAPESAPEPAPAGDAGAEAGDAGADESAARGPLPEEPVGVVQRAYEAVQGGKWHVVAALGVLLLTLGLRQWPWLRRQAKEVLGFGSDDRGGVILAFLVAAGGALVHTWWAGASFGDWTLWKTIGVVGLEAIGGFVGLKKILKPKD